MSDQGLAAVLYILIRDGDLPRERVEQVIRDHVKKARGARPVFSDRELADWIAILLRDLTR